jgi:hypothetical protein
MRSNRFKRQLGIFDPGQSPDFGEDGKGKHNFFNQRDWTVQKLIETSRQIIFETALAVKRDPSYRSPHWDG